MYAIYNLFLKNFVICHWYLYYLLLEWFKKGGIYRIKMEVDKATRETGEMEMGEKGFPERPDTQIKHSDPCSDPGNFQYYHWYGLGVGFTNVKLGLGEFQSRFGSGKIVRGLLMTWLGVGDNFGLLMVRRWWDLSSTSSKLRHIIYPSPTSIKLAMDRLWNQL